MALLERVTTLIRANLNDLIDRAEDPEKTMKQVILDMQNQLMQVKTQVAISIADQHVLEKKQKENTNKEVDWMRKADIALDKKEDDLARAALGRALSHRQMAEGFAQQVADQKIQVENLKLALRKLEQKLEEASSMSDMLIARHRRARSLARANGAHMRVANPTGGSAVERMKTKVHHAEAAGLAMSEMLTDSMEERLSNLEREDQIERLLADIKARRAK
jgi:phage shock protein A